MSEWAARCQMCGASVDNAVLIPEEPIAPPSGPEPAPATVPDVRRPPRISRRARAIGIALIATTATLIGVAVTWLPGTSRPAAQHSELALPGVYRQRHLHRKRRRASRRAQRLPRGRPARRSERSSVADIGRGRLRACRHGLPSGPAVPRPTEDAGSRRSAVSHAVAGGGRGATRRRPRDRDRPIRRSPRRRSGRWPSLAASCRLSAGDPNPGHRTGRPVAYLGAAAGWFCSTGPAARSRHGRGGRQRSKGGLAGSRRLFEGSVPAPRKRPRFVIARPGPGCHPSAWA